LTIAVPPFTEDEIPPALRAYVPVGARLTYPTQGMTSDVAFVDGSDVVVKRCRDPIYLAWLSREHHVLQALAGTHLPIPRVLDYLPVESGSEAWLVMTRRQGRSLWSVIVEATSEQRAELLRRLGQLLRRLHATPIPGALAAGSPWIDRQLEQAHENLSWCDGTTELLADLHRRRPAPVADALIHGDLALDNVLIDADGTMSLIDWSGGGQGDPRYDVALALGTEPEIELGPDLLAAFLDGYGGVIDRATRRWFEELYDFF
jgi:aminoglycoside phosphotransferase (APT) family kinase protein